MQATIKVSPFTLRESTITFYSNTINQINKIYYWHLPKIDMDSKQTQHDFNKHVNHMWFITLQSR